jgi:hypothetical protein
MKMIQVTGYVKVNCQMCGTEYASIMIKRPGERDEDAEAGDATCDECTLARQIVDGMTDPENMPHPFVCIDGQVLRKAKQ